MFKFFWGKGAQHSAERLQIQKELFQFQKTVQHGFPSKPSALAWDPILRLLAIGTKTGSIKIFGAPGVEFYGHKEKEINVSHLYFIPGQGRIISLCDDNSLDLWEIVAENAPTLKCVQSQSLEGKLKKISACCVESSGENFLIGTENGNIYVMDLRTFDVTDSVIYLDVVMQNVADDFKLSPGAVETISEQPGNADRLLIGYTRGLVVLWNRKTLAADQVFVATQQLESTAWHPSGKKMMSSHNDGSYIVWRVTADDGGGETPAKSEPSASTPYGPFPCKAITKILWNATDDEEDSEVIAFGGGMPRASYGDRHTVSVLKGDKAHVTFDLTSKVIDFCLIDDAESKAAESLVVLAEEELIVVDLVSDRWPAHASPYLASLHCSAITAQTTVTVSAELYDKIVRHPQMLAPSAKISSRPWPINGGVDEAKDADPSASKLLLLTGHEDGSVRFWDASTAALRQVAKFSTSRCFVGDDLDTPPDDAEDELDEDEWPPFRKAGVFDPYSDDPRLAVKKLAMCPVTGLLAAAGTAGQIVIAELSDSDVEKEISVTTVNIVSDRDNFVWKGHDKLAVRGGPQSLKAGFQASSIFQLHPPAAATSLTLHAAWSLLAVGTAHGMALYDTVHLKGVVAKCTLNPNDISGVGDQPMSRRKSFKKSLRESFRRLRKGRSQRPMTTPKATPAPAAAIRASAEADAAGTGATTGGSAAEVRPVERQIEARAANDDGLGSMVRCLLMAKTFIISQSPQTTPTLWVGTNNGTIYVYHLLIPAGERRKGEAVSAQLAKEIQLKHRAPVVSIDIIDAACASLGDVSGPSEPAEVSGPHRVVISSEEQFKVFTLPNLRPYGKYKLTAYTGCQVRRVAVIPFTSRSDETYKENCLVCLSNQGDFHILSLPDLRRQMNAQAIRREDIHGISTVVLSRHGEALYMQSSSELQRIALSARHCLQIKCSLAGLSQATPVEPTDAAATTDAVEPPTAGGEEPAAAEETTAAAAPAAVAAAVAAVAAPESETSAAPTAGDYAKTNGQHSNSNSEINTTIVSVEPETSFGDMTLDSIKDHLQTSTLEESRIVEIKSERCVQESVTVIKTTTHVVTSAEAVASSPLEVVEMLNEAPVSASTTTTTTTTTLTTLTSATSSVAEDQSLTTQVVESEQQQETVTNSQTVEQVPIQDGVDVVAEKIPAEVNDAATSEAEDKEAKTDAVE